MPTSSGHLLEEEKSLACTPPSALQAWSLRAYATYGVHLRLVRLSQVGPDAVSSKAERQKQGRTTHPKTLVGFSGVRLKQNPRNLSRFRRG